MIGLKRYLTPAALILVAVLVVLWLDAWLVGSLVMAGNYAKQYGKEFLPHWWQGWVKAPVPSAWAILTARPPASADMRQLWLIAQLPLVGIIGYLVYLIRSNRKRNSPKAAHEYASHGSAHFEKDEALAERFAADGPGLILGKLKDRWLIHSARNVLNQFLLLFGSAGTFKSTGLIITNTLHETETSLVIADPKGEVYRETAAVKEAQGYKIRVVNFEHMHLSARLNPLDLVREPEDAVTVAGVIIHNTENPNKSSSGDSFFDNAEQALMTALILYVKLHRPREEQNMPSVMALGTELNQVELNAIFDDLPREDPARKYYRTFRQAEDKTRACILLGFANRLQLWNLTKVEQMTATTDLDLAQIGRERTALYVHFPLDARGKPLFPLMALFWTQLCDELVKLALAQREATLPVPVRFRIDEAANIGHIPDLDMRVSTTRGLGIWWELAFQNLPQFKARYRTWAEIAGSCDTLLFMGGNDQETVEYLSRKLGRTTIQVQSSHLSQNQAGSSEGQGASYTGRELMTPDELGTLAPTKAILLQRGHHPAIVEKPFFRHHPLAAQIQQRHTTDRPAPAPAPFEILDPKQLAPVVALAQALADAEAAAAAKPRKTKKAAETPGAPKTDPLGFLKKQGG